VCSIASNVVTFIGVGPCLINANQLGNANFNAALQVQQTVNVAKGDQTIGFTSDPPSNAKVAGTTYTVIATATSALAVTLTIDASSVAVCSIASNVVTFIGVGPCLINANQLGNANFNAALQVQQTVNVAGTPQTITISSLAPTDATVGGAPYTVIATSSSSLAVTLSINALSLGACSIAGTTVSFLTVGTCIIDADQAGNSIFAPATTAQQSFEVAKGDQVISFTSTEPDTATMGSAPYTVTATSTSGLTVTFSIHAGATSVCSIASGVVTFTGTGSCVIDADQIGNLNFNAAPQKQQLVLVGPNLVGDDYNVVGNTELVAAGFSTPSTPFTTSPVTVVLNDITDVGITVTAVTDVETSGGGSITIDAAGKFSYTPPVGASSGTDTYLYEGTSNGVARTATITFHIDNIVWYVDSASSPPHDGRSQSPFLNLGTGAGNLGDNADVGAFISVAGGDGHPSTAGAHTLLGDQKLIGGGATLEVGALIITGIPANTPTLTGTLSASDVKGVVVDGVRMSTVGSTAVNLENTGGTFTFTQIDVTGAPNGIVWDNAAAPSTSSLTVTGDGSDASLGGNASGGVLANLVGSDGGIPGSGVYLNNVGTVVLRRMVISNAQNYAIRGNQVTDFTLEFSTVNGTIGTAAALTAPETAGEGAIYFGNDDTNGLSSSGTFTGNLISGGRGRNVSIINTTAGTTDLTFKGNTFGLNQNAVDASHSLAVEAQGVGTIINATVGGTIAEANTFTGAPDDLINFTGQVGSEMNVQLSNNALSNNHPQNNHLRGGVTLSSQGTMAFLADGNTLRGADGNAITLDKPSAGTLLSGRVTNNAIGEPGTAESGSKTGSGIVLTAAGTGTVALTITGNDIRNWAFTGMLFDNTGGSYAANFTIQGNTIVEAGADAFAALALTNGGPATGDTVNVCAVIGGGASSNTFDGAADHADVRVTASGSSADHVFNLPGYVGNSLANVEAFLASNNAISGGAAYIADVDPGVTAAAFTGDGVSCSTP